MKHIIKTIINKCFLLCVGLLMVTTSFSCVFAESISFDDCYMPWDYGDSQKSYIYVRPHGSKCDKICENQCREFSQPSEFSSTDCKKRKGDDCLESSKSTSVRSYFSLYSPQVEVLESNFSADIFRGSIV